MCSNGLAHNRSLHRTARFACCLSRCRFFYEPVYKNLNIYIYIYIYIYV